MKLKNPIVALRMQRPLILYRFMSDWQASVRIHFLHAAIDSGLLEALEAEPSRDELIAKLDARRPEILDALLAIGLSLNEIRCERGNTSCAPTLWKEEEAAFSVGPISSIPSITIRM